MSGLILKRSGLALAGGVPLRNDWMQTAGTLLILDFSRSDCWNGGTIRNLAASTAMALTGDPLHPTIAGRTQNTRYLAGQAFGVGAEAACLRQHTKLTDYMVGKNIAVTLMQRYVDTPLSGLTPWVAGAAVSTGALITSGFYLYTATTGGTLGSTAPTHTSGSASNGTATLAWGVLNKTATYGSISQIGGTFNLMDPAGAWNQSPSYKWNSSSASTYSQPFTAPLSQWAINHLCIGRDASVINGQSSAVGKQLTTTQVPTSPTSLAMQISAELFNQAGLYSAAGGSVTANTLGKYLDTYRIIVEDLGVSGRTVASMYTANESFFLNSHPCGSLLA